MEEKQHLSTSIYHLYHPNSRRLILIACAGIGILTPFTDTIYLPALTSVADTFDTTDTMVALTVSIYLACVGVGQLIWGPLSDYYGRISVLYITLFIFEAFTIGCIFATSIEELIILRSIEGLVVGSTVGSAQAIITDVFAMDERGTAMAYFLAPMYVGPIIAPIIGGALSQAFGWRATFVLLAILTLPIFLLTFCTVPEIHHWLVVQQYEKSNAAKLQTGSSPKNSATAEETAEEEQAQVEVEAPTTTIPIPTPLVTLTTTCYDIQKALDVSEKLSSHVIHLHEKQSLQPPVYVTPWSTLAYIFDTSLAPYYTIECIAFGMMFTTLTMLSLLLSATPYNLSEAVIGLTYIPVGLGMLLGTMLGGVTSDHAAATYGPVLEGRLVYSLYGMILHAVGSIAFGFALQYGAPVAVVLIIHTILGLGQSFLVTTIFGFLPSLKPQNAAGITSVSMCLMFLMAALFVTIADSVATAIGFSIFMVLLTILFIISCGWGYGIVAGKVFCAATSPSTSSDKVVSFVKTVEGDDDVELAAAVAAVDEVGASTTVTQAVIEEGILI